MTAVAVSRDVYDSTASCNIAHVKPSRIMAADEAVPWTYMDSDAR